VQGTIGGSGLGFITGVLLINHSQNSL
jgi:hypothetical protein